MRARPLMRAAAPAVEAVELAVGFAAELLPGLGAAFAIALAIEFAATLGAALAAPGAAGAAAAVAGADPAAIARAWAIFDWICLAASESGGNWACNRSQCARASAASPRRKAIMPASASALGWSGWAASACATAPMEAASGVPWLADSSASARSVSTAGWPGTSRSTCW